MIAPTVAPFEAAWTLIGLLGALLTLANYHAAWCDRDDMLRNGRNGLLLLAATNAINAELLRFVALLACSVAGVWAMALPANPAAAPAGHPYGPLAVAGCLILVELLLVADSRRAKAARAEQIAYSLAPWSGQERRTGT